MLMGYSKFKEFFNRRMMRSVIITTSGQLIKSSVIPDKDFIFRVKDKAYFDDVKAHRHIKSRAYIFHYEDNPFPIYFDAEKHEIEINAGNLSEVMRAKLLRELNQGQAMEIIILVLVAINLLASVVIAAKQWGLFDKKGG